jgi:hypothetical protein
MPIRVATNAGTCTLQAPVHYVVDDAASTGTPLFCPRQGSDLVAAYAEAGSEDPNPTMVVQQRGVVVPRRGADHHLPIPLPFLVIPQAEAYTRPLFSST